MSSPRRSTTTSNSGETPAGATQRSECVPRRDRSRLEPHQRRRGVARSGRLRRPARTTPHGHVAFNPNNPTSLADSSDTTPQQTRVRSRSQRTRAVHQREGRDVLHRPTSGLGSPHAREPPGPQVDALGLCRHPVREAVANGVRHRAAPSAREASTDADVDAKATARAGQTSRRDFGHFAALGPAERVAQASRVRRELATYCESDAQRRGLWQRHFLPLMPSDATTARQPGRVGKQRVRRRQLDDPPRPGQTDWAARLRASDARKQSQSRGI